MRDITAYRIRNTLGEGAVGTVKCVLHKTRKEIYALKTVSSAKVNYGVSITKILIIQRSDIRRQVKNEIQTMKNLRHPNIAAMRAFWMD